MKPACCPQYSIADCERLLSLDPHACARIYGFAHPPTKKKKPARSGRPKLPAGVRVEGITHGLASSYSNHKCRCDECRIAAAEYQRTRLSVKTRTAAAQ